MKKRTIIGILLAVAIGFCIVLIVTMQEKNSDNTLTKSGEIVEVNLEQMTYDGPGLITILDYEGKLSIIAVPSGGLYLCLAADAITDVTTAAIGDKVEVSGLRDPDGRIVPCDSDDHYLRINGFVGSAEYGYEFAYRKGPDGYIVIEDKESADADFMAGVALFNKKEYEAFEQNTGPTEGPTAMHLRIYNNDEKLDALAWARSKPLESNIELAVGEPEESLVGGVDATFYVVDGLYVMDTYIVAHGEYVYVLMGSYSEKDSVIHTDFQRLISSFTLTPVSNGMPQGKLNPQVVCEGALAYMSFISGADADLFVKECVNGEHPEVFDRYVKDSGLGGTTEVSL